MTVLSVIAIILILLGLFCIVVFASFFIALVVGLPAIFLYIIGCVAFGSSASL